MVKDMEVLLDGKINETFFYWMEALFGYDSNGVLVESGFAKSLIYQFDYKTREIQRAGDCSYHFENIESWKVMKDDEGCYFLELMDQDDCLWWRFRIQWLSDVPPVPGFMESMADSIKSFTEILDKNKKGKR
jgi:hypothetical protein